MATWAATNLCQYSDVAGRLRSLGYLLQVEGDTDEISLFKEHYDTAKADIKKRLHIRFKRKYFNTPNEWRTKAAKLHEDYLKKMDFVSGSNAILPKGFNGSDYFTERESTTPVLYFNSGVPTSATYANDALNGDYLINTDRNGFLYINRGTTETPDWDRWSYKDLTDYILDGSNALKETAIAGTLYYMARYLAVPQGAGDLNDSGPLADLKKDLLEEYESEFNKEYEVLDVDASGDGILSNAEIEEQQQTDNWVVAG